MTQPKAEPRQSSTLTPFKAELPSLWMSEIEWYSSEAFYLICFAVFLCMVYHWMAKVIQKTSFFFLQSVSRAETANMNASSLDHLEYIRNRGTTLRQWHPSFLYSSFWRLRKCVLVSLPPIPYLAIGHFLEAQGSSFLCRLLLIDTRKYRWGCKFRSESLYPVGGQWVRTLGH
jgi:hypothetical protein